jgi:hypothetical protein
MKLFSVISMIVTFFLWTEPSYAATNAEVANFSSQTLTTLIVLASLVSVLFLIKGGYQYITSSGKPDALEGAKITIRNAIIGLVLVLSAGIISSLLNTAFTTPAVPENAQQLQLKPIVPVEPKAGLTQVMLDAINGFLQNVVQSATKPLADGIISFLTTTPSVVSNSVIFNFWLIILGIADALFVWI